MKIYFPKISFQGSPLVWELDEQTLQAHCLFYTINGQVNDKSRALVFKTLTTFAGIELSEHSALINEVSKFSNVYIPVAEAEKLTKTTSTRAIPLPKLPLRQNSTFFHTTSPLTSPRVAKLKHIRLNDLVPTGDHALSSLWGDTVAYLKYFEDKTMQDQYDRAAACVRSSAAFAINVQHAKSDKLFPFKHDVIVATQQLLDLLDPVYMQWHKKNTLPITKSLVKYFQTAVETAMKNEGINDRATDFDKLMKSLYPAELVERFRAQAFKLRTDAMLMKFLFLVTPGDEIPLSYVANKHEINELEPLLRSLRTFFLQQAPEYLHHIHAKLEEIAQCIVGSNAPEVEDANSINQIRQELASSSVVRGFVSFNSILQKITHPDEAKPELPLSITHKIIQTTIQFINEKFKKNYSQSIAPLGTLGDKDFYLLHDWEEMLTTELKSINQKDLKRNKTDKYAAAVAKKVVEFLQEHVAENIPKESKKMQKTEVATSSLSL